MASLEMTAQKAFPETTQSELRIKYQGVLLVIVQGSSATDSQLDDFLVHDGNERICAIADCGQRFKRRDRARDHIRVHIEDRPYICGGQCGKLEWLVPTCSSYTSPLMVNDPMNSLARFHAVSGLNTHKGKCEFNCLRW
jgi:hypothetical protein